MEELPVDHMDRTDRTSPMVEAVVTWLVFSLGAAVVFYAVIPSF